MKKQEIRRASKGNQGVLCAPNQNDLPVQEVILIFAIIPTGEMVAGEDHHNRIYAGAYIIPTGEMVAGEDGRLRAMLELAIIPTGEMVAGEDRHAV